MGLFLLSIALGLITGVFRLVRELARDIIEHRYEIAKPFFLLAGIVSFSMGMVYLVIARCQNGPCTL